jgi:hypothetical protein
MDSIVSEVSEAVELTKMFLAVGRNACCGTIDD